MFMLSGACVLYAQTPQSNEGAEVNPAAKVAKNAGKKAPHYKMKEVSGYIFDGATKKPVVGAQVQSLSNSYYSSMTDESGKYTIRVPEFVEALYVSAKDTEYNPTQIAIKGADQQNAYLTSGMNKDFFANTTTLNNNQTMLVDEPNSLTIENEMEKNLSGSLRIINRGGMPAQGAALFMNGLNSLNSNAQPLVIVDGVMLDMQYDRTTLHQGLSTTCLILLILMILNLLKW